MISTEPAAVPAAPAGWGRWAPLPVVLSGTFVVTLDFFIVNVAIPSLQRELRAVDAAVQLVVAGYGLAFAAGLITGARLGDRWGRRRVFGLGVALFTLASAACGLAPTATTLVVARVAQGAAAALVAPQVLTILGLTYAGRDRTRAFTAYAVTLGLAAVCGQLIGGVLMRTDVAGLGWRSCFLVNVPIGAAVLLLTPRLVPVAAPPRRTPLDLAGATLVTLGLVAIVLPLVAGRQLGWPPWTWPCLAFAAPLLLAFALHQRRRRARGRDPLIDLSLFAERAFSVGIVAVLACYSGIASFFLVLALYLQQGRGLDALASGEVFTAIGVGFFVTSISGPRLTRHLGRQALALGAIVLALGLGAQFVIVESVGVGGHVVLLVPALLVDGAGMGMVMAPLVSSVLAGISQRHAGAASGVLTTAQQVANALGVAVIGVIFYGALGRPAHPDAYGHAFGAGLIYLIAVALAVAVLVQLLPRRSAAGLP